MTQKFGAVFVVCAAIGSGFATRTLNGQAQATQAQAQRRNISRTVLPVLSNSCMTCHNDRSKAGTLSLDGFKDPFTALAQPAVWQKVVERVTRGRDASADCRARCRQADRDTIPIWFGSCPAWRTRQEPSAPAPAASRRAA